MTTRRKLDQESPNQTVSPDNQSKDEGLSTLQRTNSARFGNASQTSQGSRKSSRLKIQHQNRIISAHVGSTESGDEEDGIGETTALLESSDKSSSATTLTATENDQKAHSPSSPVSPTDNISDTVYKDIQVNNAELELIEVLGVGKQPQTIKTDLRGDFLNVLILTLLYVLQGLPIGLSQTIPLVMAERKAGFAAQAVFSVIMLPFSMKLLWAPFVDSFYFNSFGKRKSWILPTQIICGIALLSFSGMIDVWISGSGPGDIDTPQVNIFALSTFFFFLYFLMATQDIAVDAWALSMLRSRNIVWAGTINNIGQYMGMYLTNFSYLLFSSPTFCSNYLWFLLPTKLNPLTGEMEVVPQGILDIRQLMNICGLLFIVTTLVIVIFKNETDVHVYDYIADLFWQLQERKRQCGILTVPLTITLPDLKDKTNQNDKNVTAQITKRLYPNPLNNETSMTELQTLSERLIALTTSNGVSPSTQSNTAHPDVISIPLTNANGIVNHEKIPTNILSTISTERRYLAPPEDDGDSDGLLNTLSRMKAICSLTNVQKLIFWLLTFRIAIAACDALTDLKLFSRGLQKEQLAYLTSLAAPLTFMVPIWLTSLVSSYKRPFAISISALVPRIFLCFFWVTFVAVFPTMLYYEQTGWIFAILFLLTITQHFLALTQVVCGMTFFALVADPKIAGTFITMLHTAANLGSLTVKVIALSLVDLITVEICAAPQFNSMPSKDSKTPIVENVETDPVKMLTHVKPEATIAQQYSDYLLENFKIITTSDGKSSIEEVDPSTPTENTSPFIQTLLKQPLQQQHKIISAIYTTDLSRPNAILYSLAYRFINSIKSIGEKIGLLNQQSSKLFFNQIYLTPYQPQTLQQANLLGQTFTPFSSCAPVVRPNYLDLLKQSSELKSWPNYADVQAELSNTSPVPMSDFFSKALHTSRDHKKFGNMCEAIGGKCVPIIDGYFVEVIGCGLFGLVYFAFIWPKLKNLDQSPTSSWRPPTNQL